MLCCSPLLHYIFQLLTEPQIDIYNTMNGTTASVAIDSSIPSKHFLNLPRPDSLLGNVNGAVDTGTPVAYDFDINNRSGFMPPQAPISRLPSFWHVWEDILQDAQEQRLKLGETPGLPEHERLKSEEWRSKVSNVCALSLCLDRIELNYE
jgi:hypothetical protein